MRTSESRGLKPSSFCGTYDPTKQLAEELLRRDFSRAEAREKKKR